MSENLMIALVAAGGVVAGSIISTVGQIGLACYRDWRRSKGDEPRRKLLRAMLNDTKYEWRELDTLCHVIGSDSESAKRLLLEVGARASENKKDLWGYISRQPLGKEKP